MIRCTVIEQLRAALKPAEPPIGQPRVVHQEPQGLGLRVDGEVRPVGDGMQEGIAIDGHAVG
jgi:hypothetical protein